MINAIIAAIPGLSSKVIPNHSVVGAYYADIKKPARWPVVFQGKRFSPREVLTVFYYGVAELLPPALLDGKF